MEQSTVGHNDSICAVIDGVAEKMVYTVEQMATVVFTDLRPNDIDMVLEW